MGNKSELPVCYTHVASIGDNICVRGRTPDGVAQYWQHEYRPLIFLPSTQPTGWVTLDGRPAKPVRTKGIQHARQWKETNKVVEVHGDIAPVYQFIAEYYPPALPYDSRNLWIASLDLEVYSGDGFPQLETADKPINAITMVSFNGYKTETHVWGYHERQVAKGFDADVRYHGFTSELPMLQSFVDHWVNNPPDILTGWNVQFFDMPYLVKRLENLMGTSAARSLSPWNRISSRNTTIMGRDHTVVDIVGVAILDYLELYKKFTFVQRENYKLDTIAKEELKESKKTYDGTLNDLYENDFQKYLEYNLHDARLVRRLNDKLRLLELVMTLAYDAKVNFQDTFKQVRMWDAMIFYYLWQKRIAIPPNVHRSKGEQYAGAYVKEPQVGLHEWVVSFDVNSLYPSLMRQWNISPDAHVPQEVLEAEYRTLVDAGHDATPNPHADPANLTPSERAGALRQVLDALNWITVDGYLETETCGVTPYLRQLNLCITPNKQAFRNDFKGFLPEMLTQLYDERVKAKNAQLAAEKERETVDKKDKRYEVLTYEIAKQKATQMVRKVGLNSAYGAIGNEHFRYFDVRQATAVTLSGQMVIRLVENRLNRYLNGYFGTTGEDYIIASDTDSVYVKLSRLKLDDVDKIDAFAENVLQPIINGCFEHTVNDFVVAEDALKMKREAIANKGVWTAKKRYIMNVLDSEGVRMAQPKLKITGIEAIKSSTPGVCRDAIKKALHILMNGTQDEFWKFYDAFEAEYLKLPFEAVAEPRSVNGLEKYSSGYRKFESKAPFHVKAALTYNWTLYDDKLMNKYPTIKEGEKIRFAYLKEGNPFRNGGIAAPDTCPPEWQVEQWLDYPRQFEKTFVKPLQVIMEKAGWTMERKNTIFDLFD
jgi:DNA polymerase elongation subunit (family B)